MITSTEIQQRKTVLSSKEEHVHVESQHEDVKKVIQQKGSWCSDNVIVTLLSIMSLPVRLKSLSLPAQVVFDEVHFGSFAAYYIKQTFFFDVHPPLAKLLIALVAWISGFKGDFEFTEIGKPYTDNVPYIQMRAVGALFGSLIVPLSYLTIRDAGHSRIAATLTALAICFENGLITNNRLILLDSYLLFFTAFTVFAWTRFYNKTRPFDRSWWVWLLFTGIGLGCTFSSKWVGLFTIATIGLSTVKHLWEILGDIKVSNRQYTVHFFARAFCLIVIPAIIYFGSFYVHLSILNRSGSGESYMEMTTQNELKGYDPIDTPAPIAYGSLITIRHLETTEGYLHSHKANYAEGSQQQQVTLYPHHDNNNWWRVLKADIFEDPINDLLAKDNQTWLEYVRNGDTIRLEHVETAPRKLHSHDVPAPVTDTTYHKEVSGYGFLNHVGDSNDFWRVQIDNNSYYPQAGQFLQARRSKFRLLHPNQDCHLYANMERLPDWGYGQQEVSCIVEGMKPRTMWMIDETQNSLLPEDAEIAPEHRPGFFEKVARLHKAMWTINGELTESHPFESHPYEWPILISGIAFWQADLAQIILLGNPLVFWSSTVAVFTFLIMYGFFQLRNKRGYKDTYGGLRAFYETSAGFFVVGWALHYLPFFFMERQLFLHHYMPALYFAVLTLGVGIDLILRRFPRVLKVFVLLATGACIAYTYWVYSPLAYGEEWTVSQCENANLIESWELFCVRYAPLGSSERAILESDTPATDGTVTQDANVVYVDENGDRVAFEDVPPQYLNHANEEEDDEDDDEDDEQEFIIPATETSEEEEEEANKVEEPIDEPTEAPEEPEYVPEFIDGKEVYGDDDEDEDDWPKTVYGVDPDADDENPAPLTTRDIPATRHFDL